MSPRGLMSLLPLVASFAACSSALAINKTNTCQKLLNRYGDKVSLPWNEEYAIVAPENWSKAAQLSPSCVFEPSSKEDVSGALAILVQDGTKFAVRGGGHMPIPGAANIDNGVLISMSNMKTMQLARNNSIAQLGPGLRWLEVYDWISSYGLGVIGGRFAPVGVPGLLLGGGISFFGSRYGWASNMVANLEVVLANSTIVNANANENPDLFWALKGGSNNFGIVTRFDIKTFPMREVYGGSTIYSPEYLSDVMDAAASYSVVGGGSDDIDGAITPSIQFSPPTGVINPLVIGYHLGSDPNPAAFANYSRIPTLSTSNAVHESLAEALAPTVNTGDRSLRQLFMAIGTKAGPDSVRLTNETFWETVKEMPELEKVQNLTLTISPQLLSKNWLETARASGGDPMDIEPGNGVLMNLLGSAWENEADDELVYKFSNYFISTLEERSKAAGLHYPVVYLNDAATTEKPFQTYGKNGSSLKKLKTIRDRYDPHNYFHKLLPGGFKLE